MPTSPFGKLTFYLDTDQSWDSMRRKLVGHRQCMRWTQAEIAERMGISQPTFSNLETGKAGDPYISTIYRWLRALGFEPHLGMIGTGCAICGDPTHSTERHEATLDDDF